MEANQTAYLDVYISRDERDVGGSENWHKFYSIRLGTVLIALGITTAAYLVLCLMYRCYCVLHAWDCGMKSLASSAGNTTAKRGRRKTSHIQEEKEKSLDKSG